MLDIHYFRTSFDEVCRRLATKHFTCDLQQVAQLDKARIEQQQAFESSKAELNALSKNLGKLDPKSPEFAQARQQAATLSKLTKEKEAAYKQAEQAFKEAWLSIPNVPAPSVPVGKSDKDNVELYQWHPQNEDFSHACPHYELPNFEQKIDFSRGSKVMGAGFPFYVGELAYLVRALIAFFLDSARKNGYLEILPPLLVNADSALATGQLPDKENMMYRTDEGYLIPTAEVPITNFYRNEIFNEADLPIKRCAYSACFRREAGSWGKDVRGLNRLHQFDKVELVQWVLPQESTQALLTLRSHAEDLLKQLEIPYRVLAICTGDMGFPHAQQYDLEVWAAGQQRWLEVSSCSCFTDFQARRANIRYKTSSGNLAFVHTLNGSGLAIPRVLAAILENNHRGNGEINIPSVLHQWLPMTKIHF